MVVYERRKIFDLFRRSFFVMNTKTLADQVVYCLSNHPSLKVTLGSLVFVRGSDLNTLKENLQEKHGETVIDHAGVYIIGSDDDILRIGEGGKGGTMGHRVFQHIRTKDWMIKAKEVVFIPIVPPEFSRLAEQTAFAIYFQKYEKLPQYNLDWR